MFSKVFGSLTAVFLFEFVQLFSIVCWFGLQCCAKFRLFCLGLRKTRANEASRGRESMWCHQSIRLI